MKIAFTIVTLLMLATSMSLGTTDTVKTSGFTFAPSSVTIQLGDTVRFVLESIHNAVEVSQATWNANGTTSNGGFEVAFGGGIAVPTALGTHYYVCQTHAIMGMKGTITVEPAVPTGAITIESAVDADGNVLSAGDRMLKSWSLKLYQDSVGSGIVLDSTDAGTSLSVGSLPAGTYVAVEADSAGWSHLARMLDGVPQTGGLANAQTVTITSGESHVIGFLNFAPHTIISSGFTFAPESLVITLGDTVRFVLEEMHTAREVSEATWLANDTLSNGGFDLPSGGGTTVPTTLGTHYYVCVPHASIAMKGKIVVMTGLSLNVTDGWNLLSLPVGVSDSSVASLFPSAQPKAFRYEGGYVEVTELSVGTGYWLKFPIAMPVSLAGSQISADTLHIAGGWNIIGTISFPVATASVVQVGTTVVSQYFAYTHDFGYTLEDTLEPGSGYWVKASQAGELVLASSGAFARLATGSSSVEGTAARPEAFAAAGELAFRDRSGAVRSLFVLQRGGEARSYELPPPPPPGILDVRFEGNRLAAAPDGHDGQDVGITVTSARYPLAVSWEMPGTHGLALELDGHEISLDHAGETEILNADARLRLTFPAADGAALPADYALHQNYPNPFNPSTKIRFDLPEDAVVTLKVFDLMGRDVATLARGVQEAGSHSIEWQAGNLPSGVYYYRLEAIGASGRGGRSVQVGKALLAK